MIKSLRITRPLCFTILLVTSFFTFAQVVIGQSQNQYDKGTPPQFAAGVSSLGSYTSADLGNVNLSNGALNLKLPLATVGGRGLSLPLTLNWSSKIWSASIDYDQQQNEELPEVPLAYAYYNNAASLVSYYSRLEAGWSIGGAPILLQRVVRINYTNIQPEGPCYHYTLPKLTLMMPDMGEVEFRDDAYDGAPLPANNCGGWTSAASRGRRWHASDGSGLVYISDAENGVALHQLGGVVITGEGTRFYFNSGGDCYLIVDRNGNKISISGNTFVDPLGRTTTMQQDVYDPENPSEMLAVLVTFKGYDNQTRYYKVRKSIMSQRYRSDITPALPVVTGSYDPMSWGYGNWYPTGTKLFPLSYGGFVQRIDDRPVISELILPDHRSVHFRYNEFGEVAEVQMPTGGKVWYDYSDEVLLPSGNSPAFEYSAEYHTTVPGVDRAVVQRRTFPNGSTLEGTWHYSYGPALTIVSAVAPDSTVMLNQNHYFLPAGRYTDFPQGAGGHDGTYYNLWSTGIEWRTETRTAGGAILNASEQDWTQRAPVSWSTGYVQEQPAKDNRVNETRKILDNGSTTKVQTSYQPNVNYNRPIEVHEFDFDQTLKRRTTTTYADTINGSNYTADSIHLLHLQLVTTVYDGNGNPKSETENEYDNYTDDPNDPNHAAMQDYGTVTQHDISFGASYTTRGNVTRIRSWLNQPNSFLYSYPRYDHLGNVVSVKDANGNVSSVSFADNFGNGSNPGGGASGTFGATYALPTLITSPPPTPGAPVHTARSQYDFSTGLLTGFKDRNDVVTQTFYDDPFNRPTLVKAALGVSGVEAHTSMYYAPGIAFGISLTNSDVLTASDQTTIDDAALRSWTRTDGFGRTIESWSGDPQGDNKVVTQYDALGRANKQSNPFRPSLGETAVYTTTTFDLAGRVTSMTTPDGAVVGTSYSGATVTVTDPALKKRQSVTDGLGRLKEVYEDPNGLNYLTSYSYDVLDNLTTVSQGAQTRSFVYDSLKRLTSATNPESGTANYVYDNNGNLTQKIDARSITTNYVYDALNRVTARSYQNDPNSTPAVTYAYDAGGVANSKGRLTSVSSSVSTDSYSSYDALGRVSSGTQTTGGQSYPVGYTYDKAGHLLTTTYPSGRTVTNAYDGAGRTNSVTGNLGDGTSRTYATEILYTPLGGMAKERFGTDTAIYHQMNYNVRGQLWDTRVGTGFDSNTSWNRGALQSFYDQALNYGTSNADNNGNVIASKHYRPLDESSSTWTISTDFYSYDSLNRLSLVSESFISSSQAETQQFVQSYNYDSWGNRTINQGGTWGTGINNKQFTVNTANNRLGVPGGQTGTMSYDNAGNLTTDTYSGLGVTRVYDAENRMTKETQAGNYDAGVYTYNGDGQRVTRKVNGVEIWQVYGIGGVLLAEYPANGPAASPQKEYGYRNGQLLITAETTSASAAAPTALSVNPPNSGVNVTLNWTAASGATNYRVERKDAGGSFSLIGTTPSTTITDTSAISGSAYLYKVCAANGANNCTSDYSNIVLGARFNFLTDSTITTIADDPSGATVTSMKLEHITELRSAVNAARSLAGLSAASWTNPTLTRYVSVITKEDVQELRTRLDEALTALGIPPSAYDDSTLVGAPNGTLIKGVHIRQLRQRATSGIGGSGGIGGTSFSLQWLVADHLGTPRIIVDKTGALANLKRHDYLPFGEELTTQGLRNTMPGYASYPSAEGDNIRQKFTSKERDIETGLDYFMARYYSSTQGRFTSPDEFKGGPEELFGDVDPHDPLFYADTAEPQSLNKYHYCLNNPLRFIDPDGHQTVVADILKTVVVANVSGRINRASIARTVNGAVNAWAEDNGIRVNDGRAENRVGRVLGHGLALGQASQEITSGAALFGAGGGEAVVTSPACASGVLCAIPAVGVAGMAAGAAIATHGAFVGINTVNNIFSKKTELSKQKKDYSVEGTTETSKGLDKKQQAAVNDAKGTGFKQATVKDKTKTEQNAKTADRRYKDQYNADKKE